MEKLVDSWSEFGSREGWANVLLESLACGTPVVASPQAVAALPEPFSDALLVAADAQSSAAAIVSILQDSALQARLADRGRSYVCEHFDWWAVTGELETIYDGLLS